jgi:hypothetical protein
MSKSNSEKVYVYVPRATNIQLIIFHAGDPALQMFLQGLIADERPYDIIDDITECLGVVKSAKKKAKKRGKK